MPTTKSQPTASQKSQPNPKPLLPLRPTASGGRPKPQPLRIAWAPLPAWNPAIGLAQHGRISWGSLSGLWLLFAALALAMTASLPARAQTNRLSWTNAIRKPNPANMGPVEGTGAPRTNWVVATNVVGGRTNVSTNLFLEIGSNAVTKTKGAAEGHVDFPPFRCPGSSGFCNIQFEAQWKSVNSERAYAVLVPNPPKKGVAQKKYDVQNGVQTISGACGSSYELHFGIENVGDDGKAARKQDPKQSTLRINAATIIYYCATTNYSTDNEIAYLFNAPRAPGYLLANSEGDPGQLALSVPAGVSPVANPFISGSNTLDEVLFAQDDTTLYKYDPQTGGFDPYQCWAGLWYPDGGTLGPGDAAFIDSPVPQHIMLTGQFGPLPFGPHPLGGMGYFANPLPYPATFEQVTGCKPVQGDALVTFKHGDATGIVPSQVGSSFLFMPEDFDVQPRIAPGETVQVFFADPSRVPLSINADNGQVQILAPTGLPNDGLLQVTDDLGATWKSLMGVTDFYSEPATNPAHFFRMGYGVPTSGIYGQLVNSSNGPIAGATVTLDPCGAAQATDWGQFSFFDVPIGLVDLSVNVPLQVLDQSSSLPSTYEMSLSVPVNVSATPDPIMLKAEFPVMVVVPPPCPCVPWCGIVGGTINGAQKVVAGGGVWSKPKCNQPVTVTITTPGGMNVNLAAGARATFSPAPDGVWTVTTTVCGITRTCTITLP